MSVLLDKKAWIAFSTAGHTDWSSDRKWRVSLSSSGLNRICGNCASSVDTSSVRVWWGKVSSTLRLSWITLCLLNKSEYDVLNSHCFCSALSIASTLVELERILKDCLSSI